MMDTEPLIDRVLSGDTAAYEGIVRSHQQAVWQVVAAAWRMLAGHNGSRTLLEELVQQVFVDAFFHLEQHRRGSDFAAWLKAIARNRVRQELRRRCREDQRLAAYGQYLQKRLDDAAAAVRHEAEYQDALRQCSEELPDRARRMLTRRYADALTFEAIAAQEASTAEAVRKVLTRTLLLLKNCIQARLAHP